MKKLNITFCSFPDFSSNAKPLYEYMVKRYGDKFNYTWIVYNKKTVEKLKSSGINAILIGTDEFKKYIPTTDVFFTTQGNLDRDKTPKSIYVELWHGVGLKPTGYMCKNPSEDDIIGYSHMKNIFDYVIAPNDFWRTTHSAMLNIEFGKTKSLGMPKLDYFKYSPGVENISRVLNIDVTKYKKRIIYMPTFKNGFSHHDSNNVNKDNIFNFEQYDENDLEKFLEKNNYLLCVKRHPGDKTKYRKIESDYIKNIDDNKLLKYGISVNEILNGFDMMITDYSSVGVEWSFFEKPIMYALGDFEEYVENRGIVFSNIDFWLFGPKVTTLTSFKKECTKLFNDNTYYKLEREKARKLFFSDLNDGGCDKLCEFLFSDDGRLNKNIKMYNVQEESDEQKIMNLVHENRILKNYLKQAEKTRDCYNKELVEKKMELKQIKSSKAWKILMKLRKIKGKIRK